MGDPTPRTGRRPLDGLRVLDVTGLLSGPYATMLLGDLGAEVIKVEHPDRPDETRQSPPFFGGESHYFIAINRNKRSVAVDLKSVAGKRLVQEVAAGCDVLIENFRPGVARRLGISYDDMRSINPGIIYCSISGFGQEGAAAHLPAYDLITLAASGMMSTTGELGRPPVKLGLPLSDLMSGSYAALLCLAGLRRRQVTGEGGYFDVSMLECTLSASTMVLADLHLNEPDASPPADYFPHVEPFVIRQAEDGHVVVHPGGAAEVAAEPTATGSGSTGRTRGELARELTAQGTAATPILTVGEALDDELTRRRSMVVTMDHPTAGRIETIGTAFKMTYADGTRFDADYTPPPLLGQDTEDVRAQPWNSRGSYGDSPHTTAAAGESAARPPLRGLRVLEIGEDASAAVAALLLADLGADVIKVGRVSGTADVPADSSRAAHDAAIHRSLQRGKRSITADVHCHNGAEVVRELVRYADIVFTDGPSENPALDGAGLAHLRSNLIVVSSTGFGLTEPVEPGAASELIQQAATGLLHLTGEPDRAPTPVGVPVVTQSTGILTCIGLLSALQFRDRTGVGAHLDMSAHDALIGMLGYLGQLRLMTREDPCRVGSQHHHIIPYGVYRTVDGEYVAVAAFTQQMFEKFMRAVGRPDVADDERFGTSALRKENRDLLEHIVDDFFTYRTAADAVATLRSANVPCSKVMAVAEALNSETIEHSQIIGEWFDGSVHRRFLGSPFRLDGHVLRTARPPARPGQDTAEVLDDFLGYDARQIARVRQSGAVQ